MKAQLKQKIDTSLVLASLLVAFFISSCQKPEVHQVALYTGEVTEISPMGAVFTGKVSEFSDPSIVDHGFVWGTRSQPSLNNDRIISLGKPYTNIFRQKIDHSLQSGMTYYIRAYLALSNSTIIYGSTVSFISLGSMAPEISSIDPINGLWGDTLTIHGKRLGSSPELTKVLFHDAEAEIIAHSEDSLKVIVPTHLLVPQADIRIDVVGNSTTYENKFSISKPVILSVSKDYSVRGDTIVIQGIGFHPHKNQNKVFLGEREIPIHQSTASEISFIHSGHIDHGDYTLRVSVLDQRTPSPNLFKVYEPWRQLNDVPWSVSSMNIGLSAANRGFVTGIYTHHGQFKSTFEYITSSDTWVPRADYILDIPYVGFHTMNYAYIIDTYQALVQYNPATNQWIQKSNVPISGPVFSIGNDAYICGRHNSNQVWKYNETTNSWATRKHLPIPNFESGVAFSIGNKGYIGLGNYDYGIPILNLYEYDPQSNQWTVKISLENILGNDYHGQNMARVLVINNKAYIYSVNYSTAHGSYTLENDIYEFDPAANTFRKIPGLPGPFKYEAFGLSISGKGYIGGGYGSGGAHKDLWEFDPTKLPQVSH